MTLQNSSHQYETHGSNRLRHPGKQPGINWEAHQQEKDQEEAEKQTQRDMSAARKEKKLQKKEREATGSKILAALEDERFFADGQEDDYLQDSAAHGYDRERAASHEDAPMEVDIDADMEGNDHIRTDSAAHSGNDINTHTRDNLFDLSDPDWDDDDEDEVAEGGGTQSVGKGKKGKVRTILSSLCSQALE